MARLLKKPLLSSDPQDNTWEDKDLEEVRTMLGMTEEGKEAKEKRKEGHGRRGKRGGKKKDEG